MDIGVSIVIVNWNSADYVLKCLRLLYSAPAETPFEVIVVDNASYDRCGEDVARLFPVVRFVQSAENLGFGGANNLGFQFVRASRVLFLNPDTELHPCQLHRLSQVLDSHQDAGIVGARLLNSDGTLQTSCVQALPTVWNQILDAEWLRGLFPNAPVWGTRVLSETTSEPRSVQAVSGACMMMRSALFSAIGGFSSEFFMYGEDLDLCHRVRMRGAQNYYVPDCNVVHHGGGSSRYVRSSLSHAMMRESVAVFLRRSKGPTARFCYQAAMTAVACLRLTLIGLSAPVALLLRRRHEWRTAGLKWLAILRWSLFLDRRVKRFGAPGALAKT